MVCVFLAQLGELLLLLCAAFTLNGVGQSIIQCSVARRESSEVH